MNDAGVIRRCPLYASEEERPESNRRHYCENY